MAGGWLKAGPTVGVAGGRIAGRQGRSLQQAGTVAQLHSIVVHLKQATIFKTMTAEIVLTSTCVPVMLLFCRGEICYRQCWRIRSILDRIRIRSKL
jgi:hypothetical protein